MISHFYNISPFLKTQYSENSSAMQKTTFLHKNLKNSYFYIWTTTPTNSALWLVCCSPLLTTEYTHSFYVINMQFRCYRWKQTSVACSNFKVQHVYYEVFNDCFYYCIRYRFDVNSDTFPGSNYNCVISKCDNRRSI